MLTFGRGSDDPRHLWQPAVPDIGLEGPGWSSLPAVADRDETVGAAWNWANQARGLQS